MYRYDQRPNTSFTENAKKFLQELREMKCAVLCGINNCGKSYILKTLAQECGEIASYLGPARYQNFNLLGYFTPNRGRRRRSERFQQFLSQWQNQQQNIDNSPLNLQQAIAELNDKKREQLIEIMENLLGSKMEIKLTVPDNSMSQRYIAVDGHNISFTSSGYRLIAALITSLLDEEYEIFLIDEPELGISPEIQGQLSDFIFNDEIRNKYFRHIKSLIMATHSTIFLDRRSITNNFVVEKKGNVIDIRQIQKVSEISKLHFFLLGNRLETLYMPAAIIIVEGKCDYKYINRVLNTRYDYSTISMIQGNGDARIKEIFHLAKNIFGDIQKSPYRDRIFVVLDKQHGSSIVADLKKMGLPEKNIIIWSKNGIEYYYPADILQAIFNSSKEIVIEGDKVKLNGIEYTKNELVELVIQKIDSKTKYNTEFESEFLKKIEGVLT